MSETIERQFNPEKLAEQASRLARSHILATGPDVSRPLYRIVDESYQLLLDAYHTFAAASAAREELSPAADWILDNFYVIREQVRAVREGLPRKYYTELPKMKTGPFQGLPRVYEMMHTLVTLTDNVANDQILSHFVNSFQETRLLSLGELWALPIMLRIALLQKLSGLSLQILEAREQRTQAHKWAREIASAVEEDPSDIIFVLAEMAEHHTPFSGEFVVTLTEQLHAYGPSTLPALDWIEQRLASRQLAIEGIIRQHTHRASQRQVTVANAITSFRKISQIRWAEIVERLSSVEQTLHQDPAGVYPRMDFKTRDRYRHAIEHLAKYAPTNEFGIAERVLFMALDGQRQHPADPERGHVGYYLLDEGRSALEKEIEYDPPPAKRVFRFATNHPTICYLGPIAVITLLLLLGAAASSYAAGVSTGLLVVMMAVSFIPFLDLAVALTNFTYNNLLEPRLLPKMDFSEAIPPDCRTMVVVPCLISRPEDADEFGERLELHALANPDPSIYYALLSDWSDASEERTSADDATLEAASHCIRELNQRHAQNGDDRFFLLHRKRLWNPSEGVWMGWERKRGKLQEFNLLLRDPDAETSFCAIVGDFGRATAGNAIRYVITLDADTQLPPTGARQLIQAAAHPLNQAKFDGKKARVTKGYGVLQPRVSISARGGRRTHFARIFSGNVGVDPYTTAVSDVYQDLAREGIYTGKGLYDVDAFMAALDGTIPENTVLSHDLLEGNYARCALVTDIELFDDYPSRYTTFAMRLHRWVRGDWQIIRWLAPTVRDAENRKRRNPTTIIGKWKIFDNLRRSLIAPSLLLFLLFGWTVFPASPILWTAIALVILAFPIYAHLANAVLSHPRTEVWTTYLRTVFDDLKVTTTQTILSLALLAHQAFLMLDAIVTTLWRQVVSGRRLLEWLPATVAERISGNSLSSFFRSMWSSMAWAAFVLVALSFFNPVAYAVALPFVLAWALAPWLAWFISQPAVKKVEALTADAVAYLRTVARRTWRYFDDFVSPENRWLAPDNYQENPAKGIARRTSPTNVGLSFLALQFGYDSGYITRSDLLHRLGESLGSLRLLDRYRGHFFNWYSTETAEVLHPRYISSVDSGNLVVSLITLRSALGETRMAPWPNPQCFEGLRDTLRVLDEALRARVSSDGSGASGQAVIQKWADAFQTALPSEPLASITAYYDALQRLLPLAGNIRASVREMELEDQIEQPDEEIGYWSNKLDEQVRLHVEELVTFAPWLADAETAEDAPDTTMSLDALHAYLSTANDRINGGSTAFEQIDALFERVETLSNWCEEIIRETDFAFLYNRSRDAFHIGYNADTGQLDEAVYDLLASEARLASYIAIAKDQIPVRHWFALARPLTGSEGKSVLISWSGTMFEYLMPLLFMRRYEQTLLDETYENVVEWHASQGRDLGLPWGISESAYYLLDLDLNYQYRAFGAHGLGLKRGLSQDYVVAPYATMLALMVHPEMALENLRAIEQEGAYGQYGFYEAIDYTRERLQPEQDKMIIQTFMAHHQAKSLLAIQNLLQGNRVQHRFHADPRVHSYELLLEERIPRLMDPVDPHPIESDVSPDERLAEPTIADHFGQDRLEDTLPYGHFLSNGQYTTFVTNAGTGYSKCNGIALTRWRPDRTVDGDGFFLYVRDLDSGRFWASGLQPTSQAPPPDRYDVWFHINKVEIARVDDWIETFCEICVSPEENVELRRYTITNYSDVERHIELTSYAEAVLQVQKADAAHPAFSKLFVRTEYLPEHDGLMATRRPRSEKEKQRWMFHFAVPDYSDLQIEGDEYETDRLRFIGRGRNLATPEAMLGDARLSGSVGSVLDPILSLRRRIKLPPKSKIRITFVLGTADSQSEAERTIYVHDTPYAVQRTFEMAAVFGRIELSHLGVTGHRAQFFHRLASAMLLGDPALRPKTEILLRNRRQQANLWAYGISGDNPICVYRTTGTEDLKHIRLLLKAHEYWRMKRLNIELVIVNEHPPSYAMELQEQIMQTIQASPCRGQLNEPGGVFVRRADQTPDEDMALLLTVARSVLQKGLPNFRLFIERRERRRLQRQKDLKASSGHARAKKHGTEMWSVLKKSIGKEKARPFQPPGSLSGDARQGFSSEKLRMFNGYGGFSQAGDEYVIRLSADPARAPFRPPMPWTNVIANEHFGFLTTEAGSGSAWSLNSRENKLTTWSNDPVQDPPPSAVYIRDEDNGVYWTPTIGPVPQLAEYEIRHGFGYTKYLTHVHGIRQEMVQFVPRADAIQITKLKITNDSPDTRRLSVFHYAEWVMGSLREQSIHFIAQQYDDASNAICAQNWYNNEFAGRQAFSTAISLDGGRTRHSGDRSHFLGRNGSTAYPDVVRMGFNLNDKVPAVDGDPCAAFQVPIRLEPGESTEVYFLLGDAANLSEVRRVISAYGTQAGVKRAFDDVTTFWRELLSTITVETPSESLNCLMNGWLLYQNVSCRLWGRTAFFQSGGAFGFRDQLQDVMSLVYQRPDLTREQIVRHAAHQFVEGDVLHWWHPPTGRGIRTLFSDDLLWLPFVMLFYCRSTGDWDLLEETAPYLTARPLNEGEDEAYLVPSTSGETGTIYDHCCRAIDRSLTKGPHGLPLMGSGDWNDGMSRIGIEGKGESVWLGFFLYDILKRFIPICRQRQDKRRMRRYQRYAAHLKKALNDTGWDGEWYRRAYFDDGTPVGSATQEECKIDAIAQAWSVLSQVAPPERAVQALDAVERYLVDEEHKLIRLLTPPFDRAEPNPGYIAAYVPGVRENGGQYTHGVLWVIAANARIRRGKRAAELLEMLLPANHGHTREEIETYKVEPYVVAADVYGEPPHVGRGGWTWYTGSGSWLYRVALEHVLGFRIMEGQRLVIKPCLSPEWQGFRLTYRYGENGTCFHIHVDNSEGVECGLTSATLDGEALQIHNAEARIPLVDDGKEHEVSLSMGVDETVDV